MQPHPGRDRRHRLRTRDAPPLKRNICLRSKGCFVIGYAKSNRSGPNGDAQSKPTPTERIHEHPVVGNGQHLPVAPGDGGNQLVGPT